MSQINDAPQDAIIRLLLVCDYKADHLFVVERLFRVTLMSLSESNSREVRPVGRDIHSP